MFSPNTPSDKQQQILRALGMKNFNPNSKYLDLPTTWGGSKSKVLAYLRDRILSKIHGWNNNLLSMAAKEVLIKSVAQAIPTYPMMCFLFPKGLCSQIDSIIAKFWWGESGDKKKIHWRKWKFMSRPKREGSLGFRNLFMFNCALLAKQFWRLLHNQDQLWARVLKALYFPNTCCLNSRMNYRASWVWSSLLKGRDLLQKGLRWNVKSGETVRFWEDKWLPWGANFRIVTPKPLGCNLDKVSDFLDRITKAWNLELLCSNVPRNMALQISAIPTSQLKRDDRLIWHYTKDGVYTVKSGYWLESLNECAREDPRTSFEPNQTCWNRIWNAKTAPRVRYFFWKAVSNCLATKDNLTRRKCGNDPICPLCNNQAETVEHVLLLCDWTRPVWFGSPLGLRIEPETITSLAQWFHEILRVHTSENDVELIMNICWQIWKARNEAVFNSVEPSPNNVLNLSFRLHKDFIEACYNKKCSEEGERDVQDSSGWSSPPTGFLTVNIDGSYKTGCSWAGGGALARNETGDLVDIWCGGFKATSALMAEACTMRMACLWAKEKNWSKVLFHSDNLELSKLCSKKSNAIKWEIEAFIVDILALCDGMEWRFVWGPRASNRPANCLASHARISIQNRNVLNLPDQLWSFLDSDLN